MFWIGLQPEYFREKMAPSVDAAFAQAAQQVDVPAASKEIKSE